MSSLPVRVPSRCFSVQKPTVGSPIVTLAKSDKATAWVDQTITSAQSHLEALAHKPPANPDRWFWRTVKVLLEKLRTGAAVKVWDEANRLEKENASFSRLGYEKATKALFKV
jgi:hypothetical protein